MHYVHFTGEQAKIEFIWGEGIQVLVWGERRPQTRLGSHKSWSLFLDAF